MWILLLAACPSPQTQGGDEPADTAPDSGEPADSAETGDSRAHTDGTDPDTADSAETGADTADTAPEDIEEISPAPDGVWTGDEGFGWGLEPLPDVDGDGRDDLVITACMWAWVVTAPPVGEVDIDDVGLDIGPLFSSRGPGFPTPPFGIGDVTGDGVGDLALGIVGSENSDHVQVYTELAAAEPTAWGAVGTGAHQQGAETVARGPDNSDDGVAELVVGAAGGARDVDGTVYLFDLTVRGFHGPEAAVASWRGTRSEFLGAVVGAADVDGDGHIDVFAGGQGADGLWLVTDPVRGDAPISEVGRRLEEPAEPIVYSRRLQVTPDLDGDGLPDLASQGSDYETHVSSVQLYVGVGTGATLSEWGAVRGVVAWDQFGSDHVFGDLDADGQTDLVASDDAYYLDGPTTTRYLPGPLAGSHTADEATWSATLPAGLGYTPSVSVALPGDMDGDGVGDLVMSDPGWEWGRVTGRVWFFSGSAVVGGG